MNVAFFKPPSALPTTKNMAISDHDYTAGGFWTGMIALLFAIGLHIYSVISSNAYAIA